jgi:hypothetical protein
MKLHSWWLCSPVLLHGHDDIMPLALLQIATSPILVLVGVLIFAAGAIEFGSWCRPHYA